MNRELMSLCTIVMLIASLILPIVVVPISAASVEVYVVASDRYGNSYYIMSYGDGTFSSQEYMEPLPTRNLYSVGCGVGDFDNDGDFDYVIAIGDQMFPTIYEPLIYLYEKLGPGNDFASPIVVGTWTESRLPADLAVADYNNDGYLDFVLTHYGGSNSELYLGNGDFTFTHSVLSNTEPFLSFGADSADFNNDGNPDFVTAAYNGTAPYYIYVNLGKGNETFTTTSFVGAGDAYGVTAANFDNDGYADIIACVGYRWYAAESYFYKGKGDGTFLPGVPLGSVWCLWRTPVDNYDFDNDGRQDIIIGFLEIATYYSGNGDGTFTSGAGIGGGGGEILAAVSAPGEMVPRRPGGPGAYFRESDERPLVNRPVTFDASLSIPGWNGTHEMPISYAWDFETDGKIDAYGVKVTHSFPKVGTYTVTLNVTDTQGLWDTQTHVKEVVTLRTVIQDGVAWLATEQNPDGSWGRNYPVGQTALAVLKLEEHAIDWKYGYALPSPFDPRYPYRENVEKGLNYILAHACIIGINTESAGNPDTNGNGKGVYFTSGEAHYRIYETGTAMMAISGSRTPDRVVNVLGSPVNGWAYKDVLQDVVDYLAWGQTDKGNGRGGWNYEEMVDGGDRSDQSNSGWATFGLGFAESPTYKFVCTIPAFVKTELNIWIDYIQNDVDGDINDGGAGYSDPNGGANILRTGHLLYMMVFVGDTAETPRVQDAVAYLVRHWNEANDDPGWKGAPRKVAGYHAMFNVMKGLFTLGMHVIDGMNWQSEFEETLTKQQLSDGSWPVTIWDVGDRILSTTWALLTLQKVAPPPIKKVLSPTEGALGDVVHVTLNVSVAGGETATVVDTLPPEWKYVTGTFKVNGVSATPTVSVTPPPQPSSEQVSYTVATSGANVIEFDAKVAKAYWEDRTVTNRATATWYDELGNMLDQREATADFVIHPFEQLHKTVTGSLTIKEKTNVQWIVTFEVTNPFSYTMTNVVVTDRFGAQIEIDKKFPYRITKGKASYTLYGTSNQVHLTWEIGSLQPGETARLIILVSTDTNPTGKQEYTAPGIYELNSGATLKFIDSEQNTQLSAVTAPIYVTVLSA